MKDRRTYICRPWVGRLQDDAVEWGRGDKGITAPRVPLVGIEKIMMYATDDLPDAIIRLDAVFRASSDLLFVLDKRGFILDYTAGNESLLYTSPEFFLRRKIQDVLPPEVGRRFSDALRQMADGQTTPPLDYSLGISGQVYWFEASFIPSPREQIILVVRDVTRHKRAEEKSRRQLKQLAALRSIDLAIASSLDLNLALSVVLSQVTTQLSVDAADILLYTASRNMLEFTHGVGLRTTALQHTRLSIGEGLAGTAARRREVVRVPNLQQETTGFLRSPKFAEEGFVSYFGVPLIARGQIRGVMEVFHRTLLSPDAEWLDFMETLAGQAAIAIENALLFKELQRSNFEINRAYNTTIEGWSRALDLRDQDAEGHAERVTDLALKLARRLGVEETELVNIQRGALLHDIGKMAVPDRILQKPGPLTDEEWEVIRQHPRYAFELLSPITHLGPALDIPHYHHEKWDGSGYPHGLKENQIPVYARLFAIVDVYDALTSNRVYRPAWTKEKTLTYIREQAGKHFDPDIARDFLTMMKTDRL